MSTGVRHFAAVCVLLLLTLVIAGGEMELIQARGLTSNLDITVDLVEQRLSTGEWPPTARYPPLIPWMLFALRGIGFSAINPWAFNLAWALLGVALFHGLSVRVLGSARLSLLAVTAGLLNPYFIWTLLLSRDSAVEFAGLAGVLWCALIGVERVERGVTAGARRWMMPTLAGAIGGLLVFSRVPTLPMSLGVFVVAFLSAKPGSRRLWILPMAIALLFGALLGLHSAGRVGVFTLSTTSGENLWLGNHPAYLVGHPNYDIDVLLAGEMREATAGLSSEAERDAVLSAEARQFIGHDPLGFVQRAALKTIWFWFGAQKIPNSSARAALLVRGDGYEVRAQGGNSLTGVAYLLYRLVWVPLFVAMLAVVGTGALPPEERRRLGLFLGTFLGLWPLVVLTFPDTRFRVCAEVLIVPALFATAALLWKGTRQTGILSKGSSTVGDG